MSPTRKLVIVSACCLVSMMLAGCRNRCANPYGFPYQGPVGNPYGQFGYNNPNFNGAFNQASRSPLVPSPATGSIRFPSQGNGNLYGSNINRGLINTNQRAPFGRSASINQQNGWQPSGRTGAQPGQNPPSQNQNQNQNPTQGGTSLGSNSGVQSGGEYERQFQNQTASARSVLNQDNNSSGRTPLGDSVVRSPDYATTSINETLDQTRLPATDATGLRAPSQFQSRLDSARVARAPQFIGAAQPYYLPGNQAPATQIAFNPNQTMRVQDQSSATYDPYGNPRSADWRNQDDGNGSF